MELLIIGMDGVCRETFMRGWTPNIKKLIESGKEYVLEEDLLSRGWSEIATGHHALQTGALYERPEMNGGYKWTESFRLVDVPGLGQRIKPFWQVLNERGLRVGVMNLPTTYPAPNIEGFFVSGGGGGGPVTQDPALSQCSDPEVFSYLKGQGYIVDERFGSLLGEKKLFDASDFFLRLEEKVVRRTDAFIYLSKLRKIDCGFIVYKSATVATESLALPELERKKSSDGNVNEEIITGAKSLFQRLDGEVRRLIDAFPKAKIVLVSDHSTVLKKADVNLNAALLSLGFQSSSVSKENIYRLVKRLKHLVPYQLKKRIKKSEAISDKYKSLVTFDTRRSKAFSVSISNGVHGIYVNDFERFGGPVPADQCEKVANDIAVKLNEFSYFKENGFRASVKKGFDGSIQDAQFPDVVVDMPDGYQTSNLYSEFITPFELPRRQVTLKEAQKDLRLAVKGRTPLAVLVGDQEWPEPTDKGGDDLTAVYRYIVETLR